MLYLLGCLKVLFNQVLHPQPLHRSTFHHFIVIHVYLVWKSEMWFLHQYSTPATHPQWHIWADLWYLPSSRASSGSEWCLWGLPLGPQISGWSEMCWTSRSRRCSPPVEKQKLRLSALVNSSFWLRMQTCPAHPQADERLFWGERTPESFSLCVFQHLGDLQNERKSREQRQRAEKILAEWLWR